VTRLLRADQITPGDLHEPIPRKFVRARLRARTRPRTASCQSAPPQLRRARSPRLIPSPRASTVPLSTVAEHKLVGAAAWS
jgi:hypothetical protein